MYEKFAASFSPRPPRHDDVRLGDRQLARLRHLRLDDLHAIRRVRRSRSRLPRRRRPLPRRETRSDASSRSRECSVTSTVAKALPEYTGRRARSLPSSPLETIDVRGHADVQARGDARREIASVRRSGEQHDRWLRRRSRPAPARRCTPRSCTRRDRRDVDLLRAVAARFFRRARHRSRTRRDRRPRPRPACGRSRVLRGKPSSASRL